MVGTSPGSSDYMLAEALAVQLGKGWGQPVRVETVVGAGGTVAAASVARAARDGRVLLLSNLHTLVLQQAYPEPGVFNTLKELVPVARIARAPAVLVVPNESPWTDFSEIVRGARERPGLLVFASSGAGSFFHLMGEQLWQQSKVRIVHVPHQGTTAAAQQLVAGRVDMAFLPVGIAADLVKVRKVRAVAVTGSERPRELPGTKLFSELGMSDFGKEGQYWWGLFASRGSDRNLVSRVSNDVGASLQTIDKERMPRGLVVDWIPAAMFATFVEAEQMRWAATSKATLTRRLD